MSESPELSEMEAEQLLYAVGLRRRNGNRDLTPHGTTAAYQRHIRHNDPPCEACQAANNDKKRGQKATGTPGRRTEIPHGTPQGYRRHLYRREVPCELCAEASREAGRARYAAEHPRGRHSPRPGPKAQLNRTAWTCACGQLNVTARTHCTSCSSPQPPPDGTR